MSLSFLFYFLGFGIALPFLTPALLDMGYSKTDAGLIIAATYAFNVLGPIISGRLTDRFLTLTQTIRICSCLMAVFSALMWWFSNQPGWMFLAFLGVFSAARAPMISTQDALAMLVAKDQPGIYARMRVMGSVGFILGSTLFGYVAQHLGMQKFFPILFLACFFFAVHSLLLPDRQRHQNRTEITGFWRGLERQWWFWLVAMSLHWLAFSPFHYGFSLLLAEQGVDESWIGWIWSLGVGAEIAIFLLSKQIFQRFDYRPILLTALGANLLRWCLIGLFPNPWLLAGSQLLHALGFGLFYAGAMQAIAAYSGGVNRASYQGLFSTCVGGLSAILGVALSGWLHERIPLQSVFLWFTLPQVVALALLYFNRLPRRKPVTAPEPTAPPP